MNRESILNTLRARAGEDWVALEDKAPARAYAEIRAAALPRLARWLVSEAGARFNIASGVDGRDALEVLYHFTVEDIDLVLTLRVRVPKSDPVLPSLAEAMPAANWIEREISEMLGITFTGHPGMKRLLLPDDWPADSYPLRQDYAEWDAGAIRNRGV
ncbi:MAG: NADH-quinone oxidoreductase subunit C [Candidatus Hydrogenedentes bacterium]|nr:NADH-quinone oxidoreductase subunit C [Candidatus Hydrogenedentota bacterium]